MILPPRYKNLPTEVIENMQVKTVHVIDGKFITNVYKNIAEAREKETMVSLNSAFGGDTDENGNYMLRFESKAAYDILSN